MTRGRALVEARALIMILNEREPCRTAVPKFRYLGTEIKKNDKFIAKKTLTHIEERKISKKAPVEKILVNDLSKNKERKKTDITKKNYH